MIGRFVDVWRNARAMQAGPPYLIGAEVIRQVDDWPAVVRARDGRVYPLQNRPPWRFSEGNSDYDIAFKSEVVEALRRRGVYELD